MEFNKVCIIGLGYIGLPTAAMFAARGLHVVGVDVNEHVVDTLNKGEIHIHEPGLKEIVHKAIVSGNLTVSKQTEPADVFIIAVPTPFQDEMGKAQVNGGEIEYKKADMHYVVSATEAIVPHLKPGNLVLLESTSPPKTTAELVKSILERSGLKAGKDFYLAYSPERVLPGKILQELVENARVIGGINAASSKVARDVYATFVRGEILLTDSTTAEMVKLMENTYRDVNIALANEFSRLAGKIGFDVWEAIQLANYHPRVNILKPGPGVGGHCISVDPWFLVEAAPKLTPLIHTARRVNDMQPQIIVDLVKKSLGDDIVGKRIALLGLAYKPDVDDLRESPAVDVATILSQNKANVVAYEPFSSVTKFELFETVTTLESALLGAEAVVFLVGHQEFLTLRADQVANLTTAKVAIDVVNGWVMTDWKKAGFSFFCL
jgi:UDP-N-acetyl-D-mannosaminuronic acid dehydrogenase